MNTFYFTPAERESEFDVQGGLGIMSQLIRSMVVNADFIITEFQEFAIILEPFLFPVFKPLHRRFIITEKFHFHLAEFPGTEGEIAGIDFIPESFTDLSDAEGQLLPGGNPDLVEIDKDRLTGLCSQIGDVILIKNRADKSFHHQVEFTRFGKIFRFTVRAGRRICHLVHSMPGLTVTAIGHLVTEFIQMAGGFPDLRMADDGRIQPFNVVPGFHHVLPPELFDGPFQGSAVGTAVPKTIDPAIDLRALKNEAAPFAERNQFFHHLRCPVKHENSLYLD